MDSLIQDIRYGLRTLKKNSGFAAVAVLTLALGVGANTAMFSVVNGVLLSPLPYAAPDELVALWTRYLPSSGLDVPQFEISGPEVVDYRDQSRLMADVVPYWLTTLTLTGEQGDPMRVGTGFVGAGMFSLLGVGAVEGRTFTPEEEVPNAEPTVILSHGLWQRRFGGDRDVVGSLVTLNSQTARVVGIMPQNFVFPTASVDVWTPLGLDEGNLNSRAAHTFLAVGRLMRGVSLEQARAELETITAAWYDEYEHHRMGHFIFLRDLRTDLVGNVRPMLLLLMAAVGLVLLIACANVANLLMARSERRQQEVALRVALGAGPSRLIRQFLTESLLLAFAGAILGLVLAAWGLPALLAIDPTAVPRTELVEMDLNVLTFTAGLAVFTAILFGLAPIHHSVRENLATSISGEARSTSGGRRSRFRRTLVAAEVALSVIVVVAAGLLVQSFLRLASVDPGLEVENLLTFDLALPSAAYQTEEVPAFYARLIESIEGLPGVSSASAVSSLPLATDPPRIDFQLEGEPQPAAGVPGWNADLIAIHPGYFETMEIPMLRGRTFTLADGPEAPLVAVINEATARKYWRAGDPIGQRISYNVRADSVAWVRVVGVVADTKVEELNSEARPQVYLSHHQLRRAQGSTGRSLTVAVRTTLEPGQLIQPVRAAVGELDPTLPLSHVRTMEEVIDSSVAQPRLAANLIGSFALIAALLAAVGIYGIVSYAVSRRTREIGIRVALGARSAEVVKLMLGEGMKPVGVGVVVGVVLAAAGSRLLSGLLFGISATDAATFLAVVALFPLVALTASYLPARRAAGVDPVETLRYE